MNLLQRLNTKATHYANLVRLEHTVFALPFAMTALATRFNPLPSRGVRMACSAAGIICYAPPSI